MAASATYKQPLGRVMPTVFVAGPAKSGSTFLWDCVQQTFHPEQVCRGPVASWADGPCGSRAFVLPAVGSEDSQPACLRFGKEGRFWTHWGRSTPGSRQYTWRRYGGPALPMQAWEQGGTSCRRRGTAVYLCGVASPLGRPAGRVAASGVTVARLCSRLAHRPLLSLHHHGCSLHHIRLQAWEQGRSCFAQRRKARH